MWVSIIKLSKRYRKLSNIKFFTNNPEFREAKLKNSSMLIFLSRTPGLRILSCFGNERYSDKKKKQTNNEKTELISSIILNVLLYNTVRILK